MYNFKLCLIYFLRKWFFKKHHATYEELARYVRVIASSYEGINSVNNFYFTNENGVRTLRYKTNGEVVKYPSRIELENTKAVLDRYSELRLRINQTDYTDLIYVDDGTLCENPMEDFCTITQSNCDVLENIVNRKTRKLTPLEIEYGEWVKVNRVMLAGDSLTLLGYAFNRLTDPDLQTAYFDTMKRLLPHSQQKLKHPTTPVKYFICWQGCNVGRVSAYGCSVTAKGVYVSIVLPNDDFVSVDINELDVLCPPYIELLREYIRLINSVAFRDFKGGDLASSRVSCIIDEFDVVVG